MPGDFAQAAGNMVKEAFGLIEMNEQMYLANAKCIPV